MFRSTLDVRAGEPGEFVLLAPLVYELLPGVRVVVPTMFVTDFASIPDVVQLMPGFDVNGASRPAAVLHDFLYSSHGRADLVSDAGSTIRVWRRRSPGRCTWACAPAAGRTGDSENSACANKTSHPASYFFLRA